MPVTKQTYTATPTWTAANAANLLTSAFTDAGLMTGWYDSFLSTTNNILNRVLEVVYDNTKTHGKCYYWFMITTSEIRIAIAGGWNATTHVPTGVLYEDYFSTATNTLENHWAIVQNLTTGTQLDVVRYTSGLNTAYSWFVIRNGASTTPFFIAPASTTVVPWLDLNKFLFHHFVRTRIQTGNPSSVNFYDVYRVARSYRDGQATQKSGAWFYYAVGEFSLHRYRCMANSAGGGLNHNEPAIAVPYGFAGINSNFTTNYTPVVFGYSYSPYVQQSMPNDFGIQFNFTLASFSFGDRVVVTTGTEEWEVLAFSNGNSLSQSSPLLLARVV